MNQEAAKQFGRFIRQARAGAYTATGGPKGSGNGGGSAGGGGGPPNLGALLGGSGLVIALGLGGLTINSALYNGEHTLH